MRIIIFGAGGHGQVVADALLSMEQAGESVEPIGYIDDNPNLADQVRVGLPILGSLSVLDTLKFDSFVIGIGNNKVRQALFKSLCKMGYKPFTVIHPSAHLAAGTIIGPGSMVLAGAIINTQATVGSNSIINTGAIIEHHNDIGSHSHIAPGVTLGGEVRVGEGAFLGLGSTVLPRVTIGEQVIVGAGAVVIRSVSDNRTVVGNPARILLS